MHNSRRLTRVVCCILILIAVTLSAAVFASAEKVIVVLDAGHGGHDGGTDVGIRTEKEYNLLVTQYFYEYLSADDRFEVILTRSDDTYLKFLPRAMTAMEHNADVLISLHFNSNGSSYVNGNMAYCSVIDRFDANALAGKLLDAISDAVPIKRGKVEYVYDTGDSLGVYYWNNDKQWDMPGAWQLGVKSDYYSINTWASKFGIPSVIVEHGYLSNPSDAALIDKDETLRAMAKAQAEAVIDFYTNHEHTYVHGTDFPSNCTVSGTASSRCTVCGMKSGTSPLKKAPDGHYWRQTGSAKATCTTDGYIDYVCQISYNMNDKGYPCEVHTKRDVLPAIGHNYAVTEHTDAGHGVDGVHTEVCRNCGDTKSTVTPGEPHNYEVTESIAPDCENDGRTVYTCTICSGTREEIHSASGHDWQETTYVEATDTEDGYHEYTCSLCAKTKTVAELACRHDFSVATADPDCTNPGKTVSTCSLCDYSVTEEFPALGHDYVTQMNTEPDCTAQGFYKGKCSRCGDVVTESTPAYGHSLELISQTFAHENYKCMTCGYEEMRDIEPKAEKILTSPFFIAIASLVLIQIGIAAAIIMINKRRRAAEELRRRKFAAAYENEGETVNK